MKKPRTTNLQPKKMHTDTPIVADYCEQYFDEEDPIEFYRQIFPDGLLAGKMIEQGPPYLYHAILTELNPDEEHPRLNYITADMRTLRRAMDEHREVIVAPCVYWGRRRLNENARFFTAFVLDLDGITEEKYIHNLFFQVQNGRFPQPSYVVASGSGMHLYWLLADPVPCFPANVREINKIHAAIIKMLWVPTLTEEKKVQHESGFQAYRAVGCRTKSGGTVRAFRTTGEVLRYAYDDISRSFGIEPWKADPSRLIRARLKYGEEWYQRRVVEHKPRRNYLISRSVYEWWKKTLPDAAAYHVRYWCVFTLVVFAVKAGVDYEDLERDAYSVLPFLAGLTEEDPFTEADIEAALAAYYDERTPFYTKQYLEERTGYKFPTTRRNGRKREEHLARSRKLIESPGRPSKESEIAYWRLEHPKGGKLQCSRELGIDHKTVARWWETAPQPKEEGMPVRSIADLGKYLEGMAADEFKDFVAQHGSEIEEYFKKLDGTSEANMR